MLFNSYEFLIFLPIVFLLYWFVFKPLKWQNLFIVIASYTFYGWWDWRFLLLMAFTTFCSFLSGILLEKNENNRQKQKIISATNIILNLLILCIFKYCNFFGENLAALCRCLGWGIDWITLDILLPVGRNETNFVGIIQKDGCRRQLCGSCQYHICRLSEFRRKPASIRCHFLHFPNLWRFLRIFRHSHRYSQTLWN